MTFLFWERDFVLLLLLLFSFDLYLNIYFFHRLCVAVHYYHCKWSVYVVTEVPPRFYEELIYKRDLTSGLCVTVLLGVCGVVRDGE